MAQKRLTRAESQAETRARLIAAAAALYQVKGYHRTSLADIAEEAGFTTGAVYSNFERKEDIALAVLASDAAEGWEDFNSAIATANTVEQVLLAVMRWRKKALAHHSALAALRLELSLPVGDVGELRAAVVASQQALRATLANLLDATALTEGARLLVSSDSVAASILALFDGTAIASGVEPANPHHEAFAFGLASILMGAFEPSPVGPNEWPGLLKRVIAQARRLSK